MNKVLDMTLNSLLSVRVIPSLTSQENLLKKVLLNLYLRSLALKECEFTWGNTCPDNQLVGKID